MNEQDFLEMMADLMDTEEELQLDMLLADIPEWDSLSYVAFQANVRVKLGKDLVPQAVKDAKTLGDLYALLK